MNPNVLQEGSADPEIILSWDDEQQKEDVVISTTATTLFAAISEEDTTPDINRPATMIRIPNDVAWQQQNESKSYHERSKDKTIPPSSSTSSLMEPLLLSTKSSSASMTKQQKLDVMFEHCDSRPESLEGTSVDEYSSEASNTNIMDCYRQHCQKQQQQQQSRRYEFGSITRQKDATDDDVKEFNHVAESVLGGLTNELDEQVGTFLRQGSMVAVFVWVVLMVAVMTLSPKESFEWLEGTERNANITVLFLLVYTNLSRMFRIFVRDKGFLFVNTGVMVGALTVQMIAIVSVSTMVFFPTPVIIDPVTGIRSHMVRWAEWIAAGFLMTFLTESVDMPVNQYNKNGPSSQKITTTTPVVAWTHGIAIGLSTSAGLVTALCTSWTAWVSVFAISWILFCSLFVRLYQRYRRLSKMSPGVLVEEKEDYDRAKYSLKTITICTVVWMALAGSWTVIALMKPIALSGSIFSGQSLVLVTESFFEVLSKIWYADLLVEIHNIVFDDASQMMRRLEGLRNLMAAVWDHSSDTLIWGSCAGRGSNLINGIISPKGQSFLGLEDDMKSASEEEAGTTTLIEVDQDTYQYRSFSIDLTSPVTREEAMALRTSKLKSKSKTISSVHSSDRDKNLSVIAKLLCEAYCLDVKEERIAMTELICNSQVSSVHQCEAKMTKMESHSCLIILRDISERYQRFQTEKKLIEEQTARRKDFEANRFTRHEVKNGILAAIGLVESLRDSASRSTASKYSGKEILDQSATSDSCSIVRRTSITASSTTAVAGTDSVGGQDIQVDGVAASEETEFSVCDASSGFEDGYGELDNTLRDVLDTIMDHAMSLDVINEEYELRRERVDVPDILSNLRRQANCASGQSRFNLSVSPDPFPVLGLDPRLLRHIYQNALSNACRYGKVGGNVETHIHYDEKKKVFRMEIVNEPGPGHEHLVNLNQEDVASKVFSQGSRLRITPIEEDSEIMVSNSSGDGAWIIKKCSKIMNGDVNLTFEERRTIFSFWCPAKIVNKTKQNIQPLELTRLPPNTWGIVIDDSGIQRKLMDRFLKIAGIEKDRRIILGKNAEEIYNFSETVVDVLRSNPNDKVLLIADENLDVVDGAAKHSTVSGSLSVEKMLQRLLPEYEQRILALVRSANDSSAELSTYLSRAHGYLLKAPIDKDGVMGAIKPWWFQRFASTNDRYEGQPSGFDESTSSCDSDGYDPFHDIIQVIEVIDALCKVGALKSLKNRWRSIQEKLLALKGDLKSTISSTEGVERLDAVIAKIDYLRLGDFPKDLRERWASLQTELHDMIDSSRR